MEERDVIIIGAGPAGLAAALFTKPDGWSTLILEANGVGGQGAIAYTVMNYPGFPPGDGATLMENLEKQVTSPPPTGVGAELRKEKVLNINIDDKTVTTDANQYRAKAIIIATGSTMQHLSLPNEDKFLGKGISYCAKRDCKKFTGKKVLVVGGGNTTAKSALVAKSETSDVTLIHRRESLRAYPLMVKRLQKEGVNIEYNTEVKELKGNDFLKAAVLVNNKTGEQKEMPADWIVICVGTEPDTALARAAEIRLTGPAGNIIAINDRMMTNKTGVFACGEITGCHQHLITAASEGASAGMAASEHLALEKVKKGETFTGAINGKYASEYLKELSAEYL